MDIHTPPLFGEKLFSFLGIDFTNTFILAILCALLLIVFFLIGFKKKEIIPGKTQNFFEFILESLFGLFDSIVETEKKQKRFFLWLQLCLFLY